MIGSHPTHLGEDDSTATLLGSSAFVSLRTFVVTLTICTKGNGNESQELSLSWNYSTRFRSDIRKILDNGSLFSDQILPEIEKISAW